MFDENVIKLGIMDYQQYNYKGNLENCVQVDLHAYIEPSKLFDLKDRQKIL